MPTIKDRVLSVIDVPMWNAIREECLGNGGKQEWRETMRDFMRKPINISWQGCHLCECIDYEKRSIDGVEWRRCSNCQTLYQAEVKPRGRACIREAYLKRATEPVYINKVKEHIISLGDEGKSIIDVGCGTGWLSEILCREGKYKEVIATDLPNRDINKMENVHTYSIDMELTGVPKEFIERFDVAVNWQIIEHVKYPNKWFALMASLLKPKGLLYLTYTPEHMIYTVSPAEWRYSSLKGIDLVSEKYFRVIKSNVKSVVMEKR